MAKVTYYENFVDVYGRGWLRDTPINTRYTIKPNEIDTVLQAIVQGTVSEWVKKRAGDFSRVTGFHLEILDHVVRQMDEVEEIEWPCFN